MISFAMCMKNYYTLVGLLALILTISCNEPLDPDANQGFTCEDVQVSAEEIVRTPVNITASDLDGDILDWSIKTAPKLGVTDLQNGTIQDSHEFYYTAKNLVSSMQDTFTLSITDFKLFDEIEVVVSISADNDKPYMSEIDTIGVPKGRTYDIEIRGIDPEGLPVTWEIVDSTTKGTLAILLDTISDSLPEAQYHFVNDTIDQFTLRLHDGETSSDIITMNLLEVKHKTLQQGDGYFGCVDKNIGAKGAGGTVEKEYFYKSDSSALYYLHEC